MLHFDAGPAVLPAPITWEGPIPSKELQETRIIRQTSNKTHLSREQVLKQSYEQQIGQAVEILVMADGKGSHCH